MKKLKVEQTAVVSREEMEHLGLGGNACGECQVILFDVTKIVKKTEKDGR